MCTHITHVYVRKGGIPLGVVHVWVVYLCSCLGVVHMYAGNQEYEMFSLIGHIIFLRSYC